MRAVYGRLSYRSVLIARSARDSEIGQGCDDRLRRTRRARVPECTSFVIVDPYSAQRKLSGSEVGC
jgi:hypothetical protein